MFTVFPHSQSLYQQLRLRQVKFYSAALPATLFWSLLVKAALVELPSAKGWRQKRVAVKILKDFYDVKDKEVSMLEHISVLNQDQTNIVKFFERFDHMGQTCLEFEMLDGSLYDLLQEQSGKPLSVKEVRPIAQQMLVVLDALKGLGVLHTDIKPDNIMLVNQQDQPFRVKLIDFGEAISIADVQPAGYRYLHLLI
ncbi:homeodomain-interacting protein kinase 1 isoform X2 [Larimichthys crocea]|uniref:homeodomain-interacting protein kinase 1 isoform X2 n=1 Tax=Larimichthys crocea TaxID=215358 RepID=UPI00090088AA|nr:homeodomain-interacting protein kinase 1 isoform X2 [Larimichthys crocea]